MPTNNSLKEFVPKKPSKLVEKWERTDMPPTPLPTPESFIDEESQSGSQITAPGSEIDDHDDIPSCSRVCFNLSDLACDIWKVNEQHAKKEIEITSLGDYTTSFKTQSVEIGRKITLLQKEVTGLTTAVPS